MDSSRNAYLALRHFSPDAVRLIRGAIDNGITPRAIKKLLKGDGAKHVEAAIEYMVAHPEVGVCVWEGMHWAWKDG